MIKEVTKDKVNNILKKYFKTYKIDNDPFEKIITYVDKNIIGIISYSIIYERAEINYIVVVEEERCKKIGSKLLEYALEDIKKNNCQNVTLEVEENNISAINLYLKYGFVKKGIRQNYYEDKNAILMIKEMR